MQANLKDIDEYISLQTESVQSKLSLIRETIKYIVPEAEEVISYGMPAFKYYGILVYFAVFKNHIGFYPTASGIAAFKNEITMYKNSKGAVQFPLEKPLPLDLISKIVEYRVKVNLEKKAKNK
jgi:uncharacterized protein YdhG (YjbR/CyaY superfamily)